MHTLRCQSAWSVPSELSISWELEQVVDQDVLSAHEPGAVPREWFSSEVGDPTLKIWVLPEVRWFGSRQVVAAELQVLQCLVAAGFGADAAGFYLLQVSGCCRCRGSDSALPGIQSHLLLLQECTAVLWFDVSL